VREDVALLIGTDIPGNHRHCDFVVAPVEQVEHADHLEQMEGRVLELEIGARPKLVRHGVDLPIRRSAFLDGTTGI